MSEGENAPTIRAVDLFCGVGGLTYGLVQAGIEVVAGIDIDPACKYPYEANNKAKFIERDVNELSASDVAAMIGGADAVFAHDYKLQNSTTLSEEISFKQQIVLAYESIINVFEDATNGSYFVEDCTQQFAKNAWKLFLDIEENGGYVASLQKGMIQKMIYQQAITEQNWVEEGKIKLIGVNLYPKLEKTKTAENLYSQYQIKPVRWAEMFE